MKKAIFEEQTAKALKKWHQAAKQRNKMRKNGMSGGDTPPTFHSSSSPVHLLHNYQHRSNAPQDIRFSPTPSHMSEAEREIIIDNNNSDYSHNVDFSFVKSADSL